MKTPKIKVSGSKEIHETLTNEIGEFESLEIELNGTTFYLTTSKDSELVIEKIMAKDNEPLIIAPNSIRKIKIK